MSAERNTEAILTEIARPHSTRDSIAIVYGAAIHDNVNGTDWYTVNRILLDRYSMAGLLYIKRKAWRS